MARQRTQEEEDEQFARRLQAEEMMQLRAERRGVGSAARAAAAAAQQSRQPQSVQVACPQCSAQNQFQSPYTPDPITVRCGSCSHEFPVRMPSPGQEQVTMTTLCRRCGELNRYPAPQAGQPYPPVQCFSCGHVSQSRGIVTETDRRNAALFQSQNAGPLVTVRIGGRRAQVPLLSLMALMAQEGGRSNAANDRDISALPSQRVEGIERLGEQTCCTICLEDFKDGDNLKTLPCLHIYHGHCIDSWLKRDNSCPVCKTPIDRPPGDQ